MNCDVCGEWLNGPQDWVKLPACADSVCGKVGLCCYNIVCRYGCQFECTECGRMVIESSVILSDDHFYCPECYQKNDNHQVISVTSLYPYIGMSITEYANRLLDWVDTPDKINSLIQKLYDRSYVPEEGYRERPISRRHRPEQPGTRSKRKNTYN